MDTESVITTVRLPRTLHRWARDRGINLSATLRDALRDAGALSTVDAEREADELERQAKRLRLAVVGIERHREQAREWLRARKSKPGELEHTPLPLVARQNRDTAARLGVTFEEWVTIATEVQCE